MTVFRQKDLLYKDSPFLPPVSKDDLQEALNTIKQKRITPLDAIAQQASHIGEALNLLHESEINWLIRSFNCHYEDILYFYIGFSTPIQMILSAIQMNYTTQQKVIKNLTAATESKIMAKHNIHKVQMLHDAYYFVSNCPHHKPLIAIEPIKLLCLKRSIWNNKFYLAGIESGSATMETLCNLYQNTQDPAK